MTEHLPECPILQPCCDDEEFPEHGFCLNYIGRCLHCMAECICDALRNCEKRVSCEYLMPSALAAGLNAAREALEAVQHEEPCDFEPCKAIIRALAELSTIGND